MSYLAESPVVFKTLGLPGSVMMGADERGGGSSLLFHVGQGVGGLPADVLAFQTHIEGTLEDFVVGGVTVQRLISLRHPYLPNMVAVGYDSTGFGTPIPTAPFFSDWKVRVRFAVSPWPIDGGPTMSMSRRIGADAITLPGKAFAIAGVKMEHDIAVNMPQILYSLTFYNLPAQNDDLYVLLAGKLNNAVFLGRAAETVRFDGIEDQTTFKVGSATSYVVTVSIAWRPKSWNEIMLPNGQWGAPLNIYDGSHIYGTEDFDQLLA